MKAIVKRKTQVALVLTQEEIGHIILALDHSNRTLDCEDTDLQTAIIAKLAINQAIIQLNSGE
jgi:hypothetical protein